MRLHPRVKTMPAPVGAARLATGLGTGSAKRAEGSALGNTPRARPSRCHPPARRGHLRGEAESDA